MSRWSDRTPADAAAEVEYMNGGVDTKWGKLRAQNGHPEPYRVKYWQIGNEVGGAQYDDSVRAFAEAMRKADPSIEILSSFPSTQTLSEGGGYLDHLCPHHYEDGDLLGKETDFADGKTLRIYAVNSTPQAEKTNFHLDGFSSAAAGGEAWILKDRENVLDSEAMNGKNDPDCIVSKSEATNLKGNEFSVSFAPFSVTLLELKLQPVQ